MKKYIYSVLAFLFCTALPAGQIVVAEQAVRLEKLAAEELRYFLSRITGEKYDIIPEGREKSAPDTVYLGRTKYAERRGIAMAGLDREEWLLKTADGKLIVGGGRPAGTLYGVYALLEKLGVAFLSWDRTVIPSSPGLALPVLDERRKPAFRGRNIYERYPYDLRNMKAAPEVVGAYWKFRLRSRMNGNPGEFPDALYNGDFFRFSNQAKEFHNFYFYVNPDKYFASHPEYFSMNEKGERTRERFGGHLCLSNPEVLKITLDSLRELIAADRKTRPAEEWPAIYDISQNDGGKLMCHCPPCRKIAAEEQSDAGLLLRFINKAADTIAVEYPGVKIRTFAYSFSDRVPRTTRPSANVIVQYCDSYQSSDCYRPMDGVHRRKISAWRDAGAVLTLWDYWNMGGKFFDPPRPETMIDAIQPDIRFLHEAGVDGIFIEAEKDFIKPQNFMELQYFVAARLMIDPEQPLEPLIDLYMTGYYGQAAPFMREYLQNLRRGVAAQKKPQITFQMSRWEFLSAQFMLENFKLLEKAQAAVAAEPEFLQRVREEAIPLHWMMIYYRNDHEALMKSHGVDLGRVREGLRRNILAYIHKFRPEKPASMIERFEKSFARLDAYLPCPEAFEHLSPRHIFGYPQQLDPGVTFHCKVVADPESPTGKTLRSAHPDPAKHGPKARSFGFYDYNTKENKSIQVTPADEKYHWYRIPGVQIGSKCIFWAHFWHLQIDLSQAYILPDHGNEDINLWDLWFRARFTGPAYVGGSTQPNSVSVDMAILVRPDSRN